MVEPSDMLSDILQHMNMDTLDYLRSVLVFIEGWDGNYSPIQDQSIIHLVVL